MQNDLNTWNMLNTEYKKVFEDIFSTFENLRNSAFMSQKSNSDYSLQNDNLSACINKDSFKMKNKSNYFKKLREKKQKQEDEQYYYKTRRKGKNYKSSLRMNNNRYYSNNYNGHYNDKYNRRRNNYNNYFKSYKKIRYEHIVDEEEQVIDSNDYSFIEQSMKEEEIQVFNKINDKLNKYFSKEIKQKEFLELKNAFFEIEKQEIQSNIKVFFDMYWNFEKEKTPLETVNIKKIKGFAFVMKR